MHQFLLVGNGPYSNRGCEAIVRGTMVILRREFGEKLHVTLGTYGSVSVVADQASRETDPLIQHVSLYGEQLHRWSHRWWRRQFKRLILLAPSAFTMLDHPCKQATCALQVGGDNFSLDYGRPLKYMALNDYLKKHRVPVMLWGASVGPFETDPAFASMMYAHLRTLRAILVRESDSYSYLKENGIDSNLHRMSDPAFVMDPVEPSQEKIGFPVPPNAIGLNLSPIMAKYITAGDMDEWFTVCVEIVRKIAKTTGRNVLLIPHVTTTNSNDHSFLSTVAESCNKAGIGNVQCISASLSAAETKWVIAQCALFAGARTHATIAAISSAVPTLSFAYSRKARGLNQDIYGSQKYCLQPAEISSTMVTQRVVDMLAQSGSISEHLTRLLPEIRQSALQSGAILRRLIGNQ